MNKKPTLFNFQLLLLISSPVIQAMDAGPMNVDWFYSEENSFKSANQLHQNREWKKAGEEYKRLLLQDVGNEYDKQMAQLNMSACLMAQRKSSRGWDSFDRLLGIGEAQRISKEIIGTSNQTGSKKILVRTDKVGIGDIFHFLNSAAELKKKTGWGVTISVRNFLKGTLADAVKRYDFNLVGEKDDQPHVDYVTHIISLLGHLKMNPIYMNPDKVMFTAPEKVIHVVSAKVDPVIYNGNKIAVVFLGEDRQANLIGGKQLPRDLKKHGRHLSSAPFIELLKKYKQLKLMDCGGKTNRIATQKGQEDQYMIIPDEDQPFDTLVALARIMSTKKGIVGFGADNGPTNVFARSLDNDAQDRMAFIIPNDSEYDVRMEGEGSKYKQMISNCWVYKCTSPEDQTYMVDLAYNQMTSNIK